MNVDQPKTLVISFQRSGINWLRHCAEHFSGVRTPGRPHLVEDGPSLFDRTHDVARASKRREFKSLYDSEGKEIYGRVALLIPQPIRFLRLAVHARVFPSTKGSNSSRPMPRTSAPSMI